VAAICGAAVLAGCSGQSAAPSPSATPSAAVVPGPPADELTRFADCGELGAHMVALIAGRPTDGEGVSLGDPAQFPWERPVSDTAETVAYDPVDSTPPPPVQPESRIVDGSRLLSIDSRWLTMTDTVGSLPRNSRLELPALDGATLWQSGLLEGDRLLVIAPGERNHLFHSQPAGSPPDKIDYRTHFAIIDLADPMRPRLLGTEAITGWLVTARAVDHHFRIVLSTSPEKRTDRYRITAEAAQHVSPTVWLPDRQIRDADGKVRSDGPLLACNNVWAPASDSGLDVVSVLDLDPVSAEPFESASTLGVISGGGMASVSNGLVYVASARSWGVEKSPHRKNSTPTPTPPLEARSSIHKFDLSAREPTYRGSVGIEGFVDAVGALSARPGTVRVLTSDTPPWRFDVLKAKTAHHAITMIDTVPRMVIRGRATLDMPARTTQVIRWFDDLVAVGAQRAPNGGWGSDERSAGPLRVVALPDLGPPKDLATLDLPGDEAELYKVAAGRLGAVGERARPRGLDPNSVEMYSVDVHDPAAPTLTDAVSYGNGESYSPAMVRFGRRTFLTSGGWITAESGCPAGVRCVNHPVPPCRPSLGCTSIPRDKEVSGLLVDEVDAHGRLRQVGWLLGASALMAVGNRLVAICGDRVVYLDPRSFKPLPSAKV
jgi:hypothetical protein